MKNVEKSKKGMILVYCVVTMAIVMSHCTVMIALASGAALGWKAEKKRFDASVKIDTVGEDFLRGVNVTAGEYQCDFDVNVDNYILIVKSNGEALLRVVTDENGNICEWIYGE